MSSSTKKAKPAEAAKSPEDRRKTDLAAIHIAKVELGLDEDNYRFILDSICGVDSAGKLDYMGRQKLLMYFRSLGWKPGKPGEKKPPAGRRKAQGQEAKIWALWFELYRLGGTKSKTIHALNAFCKRMTEVERVEWLTAAQANVVIEALKQWLGRLKE